MPDIFPSDDAERSTPDTHPTQQNEGVPCSEESGCESSTPDAEPKNEDNPPGNLGFDEAVERLIRLYETPPCDIPKRAYLETCLTVHELLDDGEGRLSSHVIYSSLSAFAEREVNKLPRWSSVESGATYVDREAAEELVDRFGLYVSKGNLPLLARSPSRETKRLRDIQGWAYWDHKME